MRQRIKKIMALGAIAFLGATLAGCTPGITQEDLQKATDSAYQKGIASVDITSDNEAVMAGVDKTTDNAQAIADATVADKAEIDRLTQVIADLETAEKEITAETELNGYDIDELEIGAEFNVTITDKQLKGLFDGEIEFDDEDYDAEEVIYLTNLKIDTNKEDFGSKAYLTVPEGGVKYVWSFENTLKTNLITKDETLKFNFLGSVIELSDWSDDSITLSQVAITDSLEEGQSKTVTINDVSYEVKAISISDATPLRAKFIINGEVTDALKEGEKYTLKDKTQISVKEILPNEAGEAVSDTVTFEMGKDIKKTIKDGEEYEKDSIYEWSISETDRTIGITLTEEFQNIDDEFEALAVGEKLSILNFAEITYNGLGLEDVEDYTFDDTTKDGRDYVLGRGDFVSGIKDYSKVYINSTGIFDSNIVSIDASKIKLGDTELNLELSGDYLVIDDVKLALNLTQIKVAETDISTRDENYLTNYGIIINNPEDAVKYTKFRIAVPEEELQASITVSLK